MLDNPTARHALTAIAITSGTIALTIILTRLDTSIERETVFYALGLVTFLLVVSVFLAGWLMKWDRTASLAGIADRLENAGKDVEESVERLRSVTELKGVLTHQDLREKERNFERGEIWVVTADLENDIPKEGPFFDVVESNLRRGGIVYEYFIPDTDMIRTKYKRISGALKEWDAHVRWTWLPSDLFQLHVGKNLAIYRPDPTLQTVDESFVEFRLDEHVWWAQLSRNMTDKIIAWLERQKDTVRGQQFD